MKNDICMACGGKGFNWLPAGTINDLATKMLPIADIYKHGPKCEQCKGTGRATRPVTCGTIVVGFLLLSLFFAFVANPIAHLISS